jgi:Ring finger domain
MKSSFSPTSLLKKFKSSRTVGHDDNNAAPKSPVSSSPTTKRSTSPTKARTTTTRRSSYQRGGDTRHNPRSDDVHVTPTEEDLRDDSTTSERLRKWFDENGYHHHHHQNSNENDDARVDEYGDESCHYDAEERLRCTPSPPASFKAIAKLKHRHVYNRSDDFRHNAIPGRRTSSLPDMPLSSSPPRTCDDTTTTTTKTTTTTTKRDYSTGSDYYCRTSPSRCCSTTSIAHARCGVCFELLIPLSPTMSREEEKDEENEKDDGQDKDEIDAGEADYDESYREGSYQGDGLDDLAAQVAPTRTVPIGNTSPPATVSSLSRMPCGHEYHTSCIVPWLNRNCTCPECRYVLLPTTDSAYNELVRRNRM